MKKILFSLVVFLFLINNIGPELIYSRYTNQPSFKCHYNAVRCVLYQVSNKWKELETPIIRDSCIPGEICSFIKILRGGMIRWLPGDIWTSSAKFEGYVIYEEGQDPFNDNTTEINSNRVEEPKPPKQEKKCERICRNKSIHGICMSYIIRCE
jgi:hypothetical protein